MIELIRKFISAFVLSMFLLSTTAFANAWEDGTDWDKGIFRVTGYGVGPKNWDKQDSFYKTFARQVARMDALVKLAEGLDDLVVTTSLRDIEEFRIRTGVNSAGEIFKLLEKNARQVGKSRFFDDGTCEVDMELILPANWKK